MDERYSRSYLVKGEVVEQVVFIGVSIFSAILKAELNVFPIKPLYQIAQYRDSNWLNKYQGGKIKRDMVVFRLFIFINKVLDKIVHGT